MIPAPQLSSVSITTASHDAAKKKPGGEEEQIPCRPGFSRVAQSKTPTLPEFFP
jgi:hypothetical protein